LACHRKSQIVFLLSLVFWSGRRRRKTLVLPLEVISLILGAETVLAWGKRGKRVISVVIGRYRTAAYYGAVPGDPAIKNNSANGSPGIVKQGAADGPLRGLADQEYRHKSAGQKSREQKRLHSTFFFGRRAQIPAFRRKEPIMCAKSLAIGPNLTDPKV
jgi:hypothetical protein